jgi:hypothetical protein
VETSPLYSENVEDVDEVIGAEEMRDMIELEGFKNLGLFYGMKNQKRIRKCGKLC